MKLDIKPNERGFLKADFKDQYGLDCSIQESSLATGNCIWLGLNEAYYKDSKLINNTSLKIDGIECLARMHLTQEMAGELGKQLLYFARKGKLQSQQDIDSKLKLYLVGYYCYPNGNFYDESRKYFLGILEALNIQDARFAAYPRFAPHNKKVLHLQSISKSALKLQHNKDLVKWLSEGQQGFYTPTGLVKELP